jgi:hypothetical protein
MKIGKQIQRRIVGGRDGMEEMGNIYLDFRIQSVYIF